MDVSILLHQRYQILRFYYPANTERKIYFLAACSIISPLIDLDLINDDCPHGGIIGIGDSKLELIFGRLKIFRFHAILHDAAGYMKTAHGKGPGYCYALSKPKMNSCFLGHISGIAHCIRFKFSRSEMYEQFRF